MTDPSGLIYKNLPSVVKPPRLAGGGISTTTSGPQAEPDDFVRSPTFEASMLAYEDDIADYLTSFLDPGTANVPRDATSPPTNVVIPPAPIQSQSYPFINDALNRASSNKNAGGRPNDPHPLLDSSLLYSLFKKSPFVLSHLENFYRLRWKLAYPLQHRVPFGLGIQATWSDLLFLTPFLVASIAIILYTAVFPSVKVTGRIARYGLIAALVLAQRNSLFTFVIGVPIDRALFYHKLAGRFAGVAGILHTVAFYLDPFYSNMHQGDPLGGAFTGTINISGSMILLFIVGIVFSSLPVVRRVAFEVFFYLHYLFVVGIIVSAFFHSGVLIPILAWLVWGIDLLLRKVVMQRIQNPRKAKLHIVSDSVVEVRFRKPSDFAYNPGQYVYITIPEITPFQSHPFSISSAPSQAFVTLHIRVLGGWTSALHELASGKNSVAIFLEGPYGNLSVDLSTDQKYKSVMLVSGGIGVTPMQSISDQLIHEYNTKKRQLHNLMFVWIERDPILVKNAKFTGKSAEPASRIAPAVTQQRSIAGTLLGLFPQSMISNRELEEQYRNLGGGGINEQPADDNLPTNTRPANTGNSLSSILDMRVYLTGNNHPFVPGFARIGRPDIRELFFKMRSKAIADGDKRVAVCVSAPSRLREATHKACILFSDEKVRFDFHTEVIEE